MLNRERVAQLFSLFTDLDADGMERWDGVCRAACARLEARLRPDADVETEMETLCTAAAAWAYGDYLMLERTAGMSDEIRVGDLTLKNSTASGDGRRIAEEIRNHFLANVAHLLQPDMPVLVAVGGEL